MTSVIEAAKELFSERGPDQVTLREVAEVAKVNHALIHRHFGTKDNLLKVVLHQEALAFSQATVSAVNSPDVARRLFEEQQHREPFVRILAYALLQGTPTEFLYSEQGALAGLVSRLQNEPASEGGSAVPRVDPAIAVAAVSAFTKGWLIFESWVLRAVGYSGDIAIVRDEVVGILEHIIRLAESGIERPTT